jgi:hypothetical protein
VHEEESGKACRGQSRRHHMGGMQEGRGKRCRRPRCPTCSAMTAHVAASKPCSSPACRMRAPSFTNAYAVLQPGGRRREAGVGRARGGESDAWRRSRRTCGPGSGSGQRGQPAARAGQRAPPAWRLTALAAASVSPARHGGAGRGEKAALGARPGQEWQRLLWPHLSGTPYMPSWMLRTQREAACRPLTYFSKYTPA